LKNQGNPARKAFWSFFLICSIVNALAAANFAATNSSVQFLII